jgi:hypothetical protein
VQLLTERAVEQALAPDRPTAWLSSIFLAIKLNAARSARLNSSVVSLPAKQTEHNPQISDALYFACVSAFIAALIFKH